MVANITVKLEITKMSIIDTVKLLLILSILTSGTDFRYKTSRKTSLTGSSQSFLTKHRS